MLGWNRAGGVSNAVSCVHAGVPDSDSAHASFRKPPLLLPPSSSMRSRPGSYRKAGKSHAAADRKSTRLNSSHVKISYAVFCLKKKKKNKTNAKVEKNKEKTT